MPKHKYLFPPAGYVIAELVNVNDTERLRSLAKEMIAPDDPRAAEFKQVMDEANNAKLRQFFKTNAWIEKTKPALKKAGVYDIAKKGAPTNETNPPPTAGETITRLYSGSLLPPTSRTPPSTYWSTSRRYET